MRDGSEVVIVLTPKLDGLRNTREMIDGASGDTVQFESQLDRRRLQRDMCAQCHAIDSNADENVPE
jgi:hypothetical protein